MKDIKERFKSLKITPWDPSIEIERHIIRQMIAFANHPEARTVPQFLALKQIGWTTLKHWTSQSYQFKNAYQAMLSILWCKWFDFAMESRKLPPHQAKILEKYLNVYDEHLFEAVNEKAKELMVAQASAPRNYRSENYQTIPLKEPYSELYDENERKRIESAGESVSSGGEVHPEQVQASGVPEADSEGS